MRRIVSMHSDSARHGFSEHLLARRVTRFEVVFSYMGLRRRVSCLYTLQGYGAVFREVPLCRPHLHFSEDGREVHVQQGDSASTAIWRLMQNQFHMQFLPSLLQASVRPTH